MDADDFLAAQNEGVRRLARATRRTRSRYIAAQRALLERQLRQDIEQDRARRIAAGRATSCPTQGDLFAAAPAGPVGREGTVTEPAPQKAVKPLGRKNYGSIPHLPESRLGPADHTAQPEQAAIATVREREDDIVIVTEKLDGSNVGVVRLGNQIVPLMRAGYRATDSRYEIHHHFARWVECRAGLFAKLLADGERIVGEWLLQAHGTRYEIPSAEHLFVPFDIMTGARRVPFLEFWDRVNWTNLRPAALLAYGRRSVSVAEAMTLLGRYGRHGALDLAEGAVWRVERRGVFDFAAKFVRAEKVDGCYLPEISGRAPVMNWPAHRMIA